ncbi:MAG: hypothetical protein KF852_19760 [Saprospiraceae bacterium]|nr:hypothetical protein [Saprospiraceae bacterium]
MKKTFLLLPLLTLALWTGCKKDPPCDDPLNPECPNYDKCLTVVRTDAAFTVTNWTDPHYLPFRDTIPTPGVRRIYFRAADTRMSRYEWKIGDDPRVFTDSLFFLIFDNVSGWINFTLTTYNDNFDSLCFPGDSGKVTVQKAYYFNHYTDNSHSGTLAQYPIFGEYLGHDEGSPSDTFRVTLDLDYNLGAYPFNLPRGCNARLGSRGIYNTHYFLHQTTHLPPAGLEQCYTPGLVFAVLQPDNKSLNIEYEFTQNGVRIKRKWRGEKLP